ncbi:MAG: hypothetical protein QN152_10570 [Armatimonadota bacterium]|nr:hypothetical protein [Armatimonadota bacterium]MDR7427850.1 hypothetical protein [Armatimonadota bacterium]MDR7471136.1 hypothetical protein [Armatimonadota bacterium]MDR7475314.1 hypothetical protein [Armatimonadota bacterium]MDR7539953.1 hypothetical protein [Armatimonadota bacterium]
MARLPEFATPEEERAYLEGVKAQLDRAQTKEEVVAVWRQHYLRIGHRKLGRLLLGRPLEEVLRPRG